MSINYSTNNDILNRMTERIEQIRNDLDLSPPAFCERIGFPYARYHHIISGRKSKPTADLLALVAERTNVNPEWLLKGIGPPYRSEGGWREATVSTNVDDRYVLLPLYNVAGGAGAGNLIDSEEVEDLLAFKQDWIARELRTSPDNLSLIYVQGESMIPTLNPGDVILIERDPQRNTSDGIYVIRMGEALLIKRLQFLPEGEINVTSDNEAYQPYRVSLNNNAENFDIVGRVVWAGRRF